LLKNKQFITDLKFSINIINSFKMNRQFIKLTIILLSLLFLVPKCNPSQKDSSVKKSIVNVDSVNNETLITVLDSVKVYSSQEFGQYIYTLPFGSKCKVLSKGKFATRNNIEDFWYQIEFEGKKGWVFGSSTSLRLKKEFELFLKAFINELKDTIDLNFSSKFLNRRQGFFPFEYKRIDNSRYAALFTKKSIINDFEIVLMIYEYGLVVGDFNLFKANIGNCKEPQAFFTSPEFIKLIGQSCQSAESPVFYFQILENNKINELKSSIIAKNVDEILPKIKAEIKVVNKSMSKECKCLVQSTVKVGHSSAKYIFYNITRDECDRYCNSRNYTLIAMPDTLGWLIKFEEKGVFHEIFESGIPDQYILVLKETSNIHLYQKNEIKRVYLFDVAKQTLQELNLKSESCFIISPDNYGCDYCINNTTHVEELIFMSNPELEVVKKVKEMIYDKDFNCKLISQNSFSFTYKWSKEKKMFETQPETILKP